MLRVGTWNVEYAPRSRIERLRGVLDANAADIWVLTETHDDLTPGTGFVGVHAAQRPKLATRVRDNSRWVSVWSRYPLVERIDCDGRMDAERTVAARFAGPKGGIVIYGTVLPWLGDRTRDWVEFDRIAPIQIAEWREIRALWPEDLLIIAGDWNQDMHLGRYYGTKGRITLLNDGLKSCGLSCHTRFDSIPQGLLEHPLIDHIAAPADQPSHVAGVWRPNKPMLSDHGGVVVEFAQG